MLKLVYKIEYDGTFCLVFNPKDIPSFIEHEILTMDEEPGEIKITSEMMSDEEIDSLGEFDGF